MAFSLAEFLQTSSDFVVTGGLQGPFEPFLLASILVQ